MVEEIPEWLKDMSKSKERKLAILDDDILKCKAKIEELELEIEKLKLWKMKVRQLHKRKQNP